MKAWTAIPNVLITLSVFSLGIVAQEESKDREIASLEQRIRELEEQNQAILKALEELRAQVAQLKAAGSGPAEANPAAAGGGEPQKSDEVVRWRELVATKNRIKLYGFMRADLIVDNSHPDNAQIPFFILSEDPRTGNADAANFTLHPRLSRVGLQYSGPPLDARGKSKLSGQLEVDFQNGGRESRQILRIRQANLKLTHDNIYLLAGQTWDVISPLSPTVNNDTLMWNAGNLGDRRPQITAGYEPRAGHGQLYISGGIGLTGAIDALDLDNDGFRDGEESSRPNLQARIGYSHDSWVQSRKASFGVWGHRGWEKTTRPVASRTQFRSQSLGIDFDLPLHARLAVRGEGWLGRNLSDVRGGIGQGINIQTAAAIRSRGGWAEANLKVHERFTLSPGFTLDDPRDEDIAQQARTRNRAWYIANRLSLGGGLLLGADYLRWITDYKGLLRGADNRFNLFMQYGF